MSKYGNKAHYNFYLYRVVFVLHMLRAFLGLCLVTIHSSVHLSNFGTVETHLIYP